MKGKRIKRVYFLSSLDFITNSLTHLIFSQQLSRQSLLSKNGYDIHNLEKKFNNIKIKPSYTKFESYGEEGISGYLNYDNETFIYSSIENTQNNVCILIILFLSSNVFLKIY